MTVYFFEGINGIGKSTLIRAFPDDDAIKELFDDRQELNLTGKSRINAIWDSSIKLYKKYSSAEVPILINRSFLSEIVYSKVLNRAYSQHDMAMLNRMWTNCNAKLIYLKRDFPIEIILQRRSQFTETFLLKIESLYDEFLKTILLDIITIPVKEDASEAFELLKKIIK